jgi:hypothetical protein
LNGDIPVFIICAIRACSSLILGLNKPIFRL